jgi:Aspartyl protease
VINAAIGVSEARSAALVAAKQPIPGVVVIRALLDTGASGTCIDPTLLKGLGLTPTGNIQCHTPSTGAAPHSADSYDVSLAIYSDVTQPYLHLPTLAVMASDLFAVQGIHALIGRDVLASCLLTYNGSMGQFTLAF